MTRRTLLALPLAAVAAPVVAEAAAPAVPEIPQWVLDTGKRMATRKLDCDTLYNRPYHNPSSLWPPGIVAKILEEVRDVRE